MSNDLDRLDEVADDGHRQLAGDEDAVRDDGHGRGALGKELVRDEEADGGDSSKHGLSFSRADKLRRDTAAIQKSEVTGTGDSSRSELVSEFVREFSMCISAPSPRFMAEQMFDWLVESGALKMRRVSQMPPGLDYELLLNLKEIFNEFVTALQADNATIRVFALCHVIKGRMPFFGDFSMMTDPVTNAPHTQKSFADWLCDEKNPDREYLRMTKQNICKEVQRIYDWLQQLGLEIPLPEGARKPAARKKMADKANQRLAGSTRKP